MSLSDCPRCWDTPCTCGYQYREYSRIKMKALIAGIIDYRPLKESVEILKEILEELTIKERNGFQ